MTAVSGIIEELISNTKLLHALNNCGACGCYRSFESCITCFTEQPAGTEDAQVPISCFGFGCIIPFLEFCC